MSKSVDEVIEGMAVRIETRLFEMSSDPSSGGQERYRMILAELSPLKGLIEAAQGIVNDGGILSTCQCRLCSQLRTSLTALLEDQ